MHESPRIRLVAYGMAVLAPAVTLLVEWPLWPVRGDRVLYMAFFPAVLIAAYLGGFWPGLLTTFLSALAATYFLVDPPDSLAITTVHDAVAVSLFVLVGAVISGLSESLHRARHRLVAEERRRAEEALSESEERFRSLVQNSSDVISLFDAEGTVLYQAPSLERLLGHRPQDRIGRNVFRDPIVHPEDMAAKRAFFDRILSRPGAPVTAEFRLRHADGSWRDIEAIGQSFLHDPSVAGIITNYRDVTERKRLEDELRQANARVDLAVRGSHVGIWEVDMPDGDYRHGRVHYVNIWEQLGYEPPDSSTDSETGLAPIHPDDRVPLEAAIRSYRAGETGEFEVESRARHKDGSYRWMLSRGVAVRDAGGKPIRFLGSGVDITDRKRAEEALRESEEQFRRAVLYAPFPILIHAEGGEVLQVSQTWTELTGYTQEELRTISDWTGRAFGERKGLVESDIERLYHLDARVEEGEYVVTTRGGETRIWDFHSAPLGRLPDGRRRVISMAVDVTERKRAEAELRQAKEAAEAANRAKDEFLANV